MSACLVILVGKSWGITSIRIDHKNNGHPYPLPTGQITALYAKHHGNYFLKYESSGVPVYNQPYQIKSIAPADSIRYLDVVVSANKQHVFFHVINRHYHKDMNISLDLSALERIGNQYTQYSLTGNFENNQPCQQTPLRYGCLQQTNGKCRKKMMNCTLPKRSVSVLKIHLH